MNGRELVISAVRMEREGFRIEADFKVKSGERVALLGRSGCGKTTLLRGVAGFEPLTHGQVLSGDLDLSALPPERREVGFVFQDLALFPALSVGDNLEFGLRVRGLSKAERLKRLAPWVERFGLRGRESEPVGNLSGGERQRVALIRTWVTGPRALLLDEPFTALDPGMRAEFRAALLEVLAENPVPVLWVTHDHGELEAFATSRITVEETSGGGIRRFVREGSPSK